MHHFTPHQISKKRVQLALIDNNKKEKNKESEENKENKNNTSLNKHLKNFFISQQGTPLNKEIEKKMRVNGSLKNIKKKICAPNFDKMLPRFLDKTKKFRYLSNADYTPNYNAIFSGVLDNKPVDLVRRKKYYNLKKIISIFNPTSEFLLFPELNSKE